MSEAGTGGSAGVGGVPEPCGATQSCVGSFARRSPMCALPAKDENVGGMAPMHPPDCPEEDFSECEASPPECATDLDCGAQSYCTFYRQVYYEPYGSIVSHRCVDACETDADCDDGYICECGSVTKESTRETATLGTCRSARCDADTDCGDGFSCISPSRDDGENQHRYSCQSAADECWGVEDCPMPPNDDCMRTRHCEFKGDRHVCTLHTPFTDCELE